ncbi:MAG TPA: biopolymer transporter ExbD [Burkholderiales bacterium]|nr:biopolymer transporter ExbD [Burkholderiales bacterium]
MDFRRGYQKEEPEINLVPLIDVLLVILIFLMVSTTYNKYSELKINLPKANAEKQEERPNEVNVAIDAAGHYFIEDKAVNTVDPDELSEQLRKAAGNAKNPVIVINADANATHQTVIRVLEAARIAGYSHVTFTAETRTPK